MIATKSAGRGPKKISGAVELLVFPEPKFTWFEQPVAIWQFGLGGLWQFLRPQTPYLSIRTDLRGVTSRNGVFSTLRLG
jgi:hypothetical protein